MKIRYLGMLFVSALAGVLSGFMWLMPNGLMGGALGMSLAVGAIWLGMRQQKQGGQLTRHQIFQAGLISGLLGGVAMAAIAHACAGMKRYDFGPPVLPFWAPLLMGILYGLVIHHTYASRRASTHPLRTALLTTCVSCFLLKTVATIFYIAIIERASDPGGILLGSGMISLLGAVPFALLWVLGMAWSDPAWAPPATASAEADTTT